ncbi:hypothetical protein ACH4CE_37130 [Streptomyces gelaticus]|uniref:hypothetical protein n=1 Tax=Streptomyces gelaticus TaxID=285446 RepID=UPI0037A24475
MTSVGGGAVRAWSWNQHYWKKALAAAGVIATPDALPKGSTANLAYGDTREFGFHAMRHTYASVQPDARESVVSVSKWLGHADPAITLRVYAHFMPEADGRGREAMDAWFEDATEADSQKISPDSPRAPSRGGVSTLPDGPAASDQTKSAAPSENEKDLVGVGS